MVSTHGGPRDRTARRRSARRRSAAPRSAALPQLPVSGWLQSHTKLTELVNSGPSVAIVYITVQAGWAPLQVYGLIGLLVAAFVLRTVQRPGQV